MIDRYSDFVIQWRKTIIFICIAAVMLVGLGAKDINMATSFRAYFSPDNPQLLAFEEVEEEFSKQDNVFFYISHKNGDIFNRQTLSLIWELTEEGWKLPYAQRSSSIANHQHTEADGDDLNVEYLIENLDILDSQDNIERIKRIVLNEPTLKNNASNTDGTAAGVIVKLNIPDDDPQATADLYYTARDLVKNLREKYPNNLIMLGGTATTNAAITNVFKEDVGTLVAATYTMFMVMLILMLRTVSGMFVTILIIAMSTIATFGVFNGLGFIITPTQSFVPTAITTIAIADVVHILVTYYHELGTGRAKYDAIKEAIRINAQPVFITSISTAIGVLCLNTSDAPPYQLLGNMIAFGVMMAYLLTMLFLPAVLAELPAPKGKIQKGDAGQDHFMMRFAEWVIGHYKPLLFGMGALTIGSFFFISNNIVTERWNEYFDESYEIRQVLEKTNEKMSGVHRFQYTIRSKTGENGIYSPEYMQQLEAFANWYREQDKVGYVETLTDTIKRLNMNLHNDDPNYYRIPDSQQEAAQYFLLYEFSLPQGLGLEDIQNVDRSATRMSVVVRKSDSEEMIAMDQRAQAWAAQNAPDLEVSEGTGLDLIFSHMAGRNTRSLLMGSAAALVMISIVLIFALRSLRMGIISLVPNIIPIVIAYGIWGVLAAEISQSVAVVISISLGIVVDDTVHFLSKYLRARNEKNLGVRDGIRYAFSTVGVALLVTSAVLISGFLLMLFSHFNPSKDMGTLMGLTIGFAIIVDFLLLPPLLMVLDKRKYQAEEKTDH